MHLLGCRSERRLDATLRGNDDVDDYGDEADAGCYRDLLDRRGDRHRDEADRHQQERRQDLVRRLRQQGGRSLGVRHQGGLQALVHDRRDRAAAESPCQTHS